MSSNQTKWNLSCDISEGWDLEKPRRRGGRGWLPSQAGTQGEAKKPQGAGVTGLPKGLETQGRWVSRWAPGTHSSRPERVTDWPRAAQPVSRAGPGSTRSLMLSLTNTPLGAAGIPTVRPGAPL